MLTSSRGVLTVLAAVASYLGGRSRHAAGACLAGALIFPLICLAYIVLNGEFVQGFEQIVVFTLTQYSSVTKLPFGYGLPWYYPDFSLFPLAGLLALAIVALEFPQTFANRLFRSSLWFWAAGLVGAFPRPDGAHIIFTEPFVLPLMGYCISRLSADWNEKAKRSIFALGVLWCLPPAVGLIHKGISEAVKSPVETAKGKIVLVGYQQDGGRQLFEFLASQKENEGYFFYPYMPMVPYLAQREQGSRYDIFIPGYTTKAQYYEACQDVLEASDWVIFDRDFMSPSSWRIVFPDMKDPSPPDTRAFEQAIEQNFRFVRRIGVFEIRQRVGVVDQGGCGRILQ